MPYIVGDSYGGVQASQDRADALRHAAFANSMANILGSLRERNEMSYRNRALQAEQDYRAKALELQRDEATWRNQVAQEHNRILQQGTTQYGKFIDWQMNQPTAQQERENQFNSLLAGRQAEAGLFNDAGEVKSAFPHLSDAEAGVLADQSQRARASVTYEYNTAQDAAGAYNRKAELEGLIKTAKEEPRPDVPWYRSTADARKLKIDPLQKELDTVNNRVNTISKDKRLSAMVNYDPKTGKYVPAVPAPNFPTSGSFRGSGAAPTPEDEAGGVMGPSELNLPPVTNLAPTSEANAGGVGPSTRTASLQIEPDQESQKPPPGSTPTRFGTDRYGQQVMSTAAPTETGSTGPAPSYNRQGEIEGSQMPLPQDNPPAGPIGMPQRRYQPMVYDRVNYYLGHGWQPGDALRQALRETAAVQGP